MPPLLLNSYDGSGEDDFGRVNGRLEMLGASRARLVAHRLIALGAIATSLLVTAYFARGNFRLLSLGALCLLVGLALSQLVLVGMTARRLGRATLALAQLAGDLSHCDDVPQAAEAGLQAARTLLRPKVKVGIGVTVDGSTVSLGEPLGGVQLVVGDEHVRMTISGPVAQHESWCCNQIAIVVGLALTAVQHRTDRVAAAAEADWRVLSGATSEVGFILDPDGTVIKTTPNATQIFGEGLLGSRLSALLPVEVIAFKNCDFQDPNDVHRWFRIRYQEAASETFVATISDVSEELRAQRIDADTGLANLADFARLENIEHSTILLVRADNFGQIKQAAGVEASQKILSILAVRLQAHFRTGIDQIWRGTGPTFLVVSPGAGNDVAWVETKRLLLNTPATIEDATVAMPITVALVPVTASISTDEALRKAEVTLEYASRSNPDRVVAFSPELQIKAEREYELSSDLAAAEDRLSSIGLGVHYQPVVDAFDGRVTAVEGLARWDHPRLGAVGPDEFIKVAERAGLVEQIDRFVLQTAIKDARALRAADPDIAIQVNLSPVGLTPARVREVSDTVVAALGANSNFTIEIIESAIGDDNLTGILGALGDMRSAGIGVSLDDFGVGESNFSRLARLPLTQVKLANVFTTDVSPELAVGVITTIHNMGLECVVEGVETVPQADQMQAAGADAIQGWLFAKAGPVAEAAAFVKARNSDIGARSDAQLRMDRY